MQFILQRLNDNRKSTIGALFKKVTGGMEKLVLQAFTLEDEYRDEKVMSETRIPAGFYKLGIQKNDTPMTLKYRTKYQWFKSHIQVLNVKGFEGIYLHIGNTDADSSGCILFGDSVDNNTVADGTVNSSTVSFKRFYENVYEELEGGAVVTLEIRDESFLLGK